MNELKTIRQKKRLTQKEAAAALGVSLRSYITYENDEEKVNTPKYRFLISELDRINRIDEEHGILSLIEIQKTCEEVFQNYEINYCYLFGSYAKGKPSESSDVDLLVSATVFGLRFYELNEQLREKLNKKVDLLDSRQLINNLQLIDEVLKDGIRIYG